MKISLSPDILLCGWLCLKNQLTNSQRCLEKKSFFFKFLFVFQTRTNKQKEAASEKNIRNHSVKMVTSGVSCHVVTVALVCEKSNPTQQQSYRQAFGARKLCGQADMCTLHTCMDSSLRLQWKVGRSLLTCWRDLILLNAVLEIL